MAGVYISFPFCAQKCTFCNFASGVFPADLERRYLEALAREVRTHAWRWTPETVYLGGGTPARIPAETLQHLLSLLPGAPWREATIEAAPGMIGIATARAWRQAGIDRVSLGVQSFDARELAQTGRKHNAAIVHREVQTLREAGIGKINIDLIAGLPYQTEESWRASLQWIETISPDHVSVYMLEVDEDSRLGLEILREGSRYGARNAPSVDQTAEHYEMAVERLAAMGLARYEISNFALPGHESLHNLKYWTLAPYVGFGADAHSFDGAVRSENAEEPAEYVHRMETEASACVSREAAPVDAERFFVGLRLMRGVRPTDEERRKYAAAIARFSDAGLLVFDGEWLRLTGRGVLLSNEVFQEFLP